MTLNQPYYIDKRTGSAHIDLDGEWQFCYTDVARDDVENLDFEYTTTIPSSVYHSLHRAGILPDPYYGTNSKLYHWVDEKVWYYKRNFTLDRADFCGNAYLSFEGVSYYSRLWLNGILLGDHEGMFGGPVCDVFEYLKLDGENEIFIEVKACNFGKKEGYDEWNKNGDNPEIIPWNIVRDTYTSNGHFAVLGLWNSVRLELVPKMHLSRPYLFTQSISDGFADLKLECQIADGRLFELARYFGTGENSDTYNRAYDSGLRDAYLDRTVQIRTVISDGDGIACECLDDVKLTDFDALGIDSRYHELQFFEKKIRLDNPKLWYPNGLGDPHLYDVKITLLCDGEELDTHQFKFGVRTFTSDYTAGNRYRTRWQKFLFSVNGREIFLKGINWTPIDYLYDISPDRYEWCLAMAKNMGVQLIRVWNGGGMPETDTFYEMCDRLGLMVWQDLFITNTQDTHAYPQDILESQTAYNLYRIRNHTSLVLICGGNEFNPYSYGNAASLFVLERTANTLVPDRIFHYTTADRGSAHIYIDMEPVWFRHRYSQLPFLAESGLHSLPNFKSIKKLIGEKEYSGTLPDMASPEFALGYPELLNHFSEYRPERVPRLTARISQIVDTRNVTLAELCEASHVQVFEFYQLMVQSMRENYPRSGGVMPWVFKRPWTTAATQTVDGNDLPTLAYYAIQNAYRPVNVCWCQEWSVLCPRESLPLTVKVFNQNSEDLSDAHVTLTVYRPDLSVFAEYSAHFANEVDFGHIELDDCFTDTCFLVCADLEREGVSVARTVYFNKCTSLLSDAELYKKYRTSPTENLRLDNGPWLKPSVASAKKATLKATRLEDGTEGGYGYARVLIENVSDSPAYPVTIDLCDEQKRFFLDDNFFMLKPYEKKTVRITCDDSQVGNISVSLWNGESATL
ncbi:MAG: hypothetical protein E7649_07390 [Ruminococcaceae bacterium]|nr:hypothetical protein [Oscillospiraceae bacterium]